MEIGSLKDSKSHLSNYFFKYMYYASSFDLCLGVSDKLIFLIDLMAGNYTSNGYLKVSCNGGLNQMRSAVS